MTQLSPFRIESIYEAVRRTHRLLVVEEGTYTMGWGAEIIARSVENFGEEIYKIQRVAALDSPIPASKSLENAVLPDIEDIVHAVKMMV
jgi:pyruvate dehydrogenase E1 component beta subunit